MFSIINDITTTQQLKENDIIQGFESKLNKYSTVKFDKFQRNDFTIVHSQCNVRYCIEGFK
jgi:myosin heavy subunit